MTPADLSLAEASANASLAGDAANAQPSVS